MALKTHLAIILVLAFSSVGMAKDKEISHKVGKDETAWFLAHVFYGKGAEYTKILAANGLKSADDLVTGKEIKIVNPVHHPEQATFTDRYTKLWEKREKELAAKKSLEGSATQVVVPSKKIVQAQSVSDLPFTEVKDPEKSPVDKAKAELQKLFEKESFQRTSREHGEPF